MPPGTNKRSIPSTRIYLVTVEHRDFPVREQEMLFIDTGVRTDYIETSRNREEFEANLQHACEVMAVNIAFIELGWRKVDAIASTPAPLFDLT